MGWARINVGIAELREPLPAEVIAGASKELEGAVLLGLDRPYNPCSIALSYIYSLEDDVVEGRVRRRPISVLLNLTGGRQVRDVVDRIRECKFIAAVWEEESIPGDLVDALERLGVELSNSEPEGTPVCDPGDLQRVTASRVERLR